MRLYVTVENRLLNSCKNPDKRGPKVQGLKGGSHMRAIADVPGFRTEEGEFCISNGYDGLAGSESGYCWSNAISALRINYIPLLWSLE